MYTHMRGSCYTDYTKAVQHHNEKQIRAARASLEHGAFFLYKHAGSFLIFFRMGDDHHNRDKRKESIVFFYTSFCVVHREAVYSKGLVRDVTRYANGVFDAHTLFGVPHFLSYI